MFIEKDKHMKRGLSGVAGTISLLCCTAMLSGCDEFLVAVSDAYPPRHREPDVVVVDTAPGFIFLPDQGFAVAEHGDSPVIYYERSYYVYDGRFWYSSARQDGPWIVLRDVVVPPPIRRYRVDEIVRYRDAEYRRRYPAPQPPPRRYQPPPPAVVYPVPVPQRVTPPPPVFGSHGVVTLPAPTPPASQPESSSRYRPAQSDGQRQPADRNEKRPARSKKERDGKDDENNDQQAGWYGQPPPPPPARR